MYRSTNAHDITNIIQNDREMLYLPVLDGINTGLDEGSGGGWLLTTMTCERYKVVMEIQMNFHVSSTSLTAKI